MSAQNNGSGAKAPTFSERMEAAWNRFWFTPADPTVLGLMRLCAGAITLYTVLVYTPSLQQFFGEHAWWDLPSALRHAREKPAVVQGTLRGRDFVPDFANEEEKEFAAAFYQEFNFDYRAYHLPFPTTAQEKTFLYEFSREFGQPPAVKYPANEEERKDRFEYARRHGGDRLSPSVYATGTPIWSIWFHVTDPNLMSLVQCGIVLSTFLFMIGFCTRITSVLTWMGHLSYVHRSTYQLFGVDTMMTILLLYLMIGPSGAAWSVDRRIARWWSKARPHIINRWRAFWKLPPLEFAPPRPLQQSIETSMAARPLSALEIAPARGSRSPQPLVSANVAIRLLQVHVCFIYAAAGFSKLQGQSWWNGTAVWSTLANYEFAPMQFEIYNKFLRILGTNQLVFMGFLTVASYFTLAFEIGYAFLIWRKSLRWVVLGMAIVLHGVIGLFMGLKTFSFIMLVMNMAFLTTEEANWAMGFLSRKLRGRTSVPGRPSSEAAVPRPAKEAAAVAAGQASPS
jgi:hypothetical protein